jgi:molybdopterin-binding protein
LLLGGGLGVSIGHRIVAMPKSVPLFKPREAANMLGISYPTVKQWILSGKLKTVQTPGGHHRISEAALKPFLKRDAAKPSEESRARYRRVSGRNQLVGRVVELQIDGLLAKVVISIGDQRVTSIVTADAVREMGLKKGDAAAALIKATEVMVERL